MKSRLHMHLNNSGIEALKTLLRDKTNPFAYDKTNLVI
jgi:hypothetical protein